jgi:transcriptional regulator with XRE-family HTH domain
MKHHGASQNALAKEMGVSPTYVSRWFTRNVKRRVIPELATVQRIEEAMGRLSGRTAA